MKDYSTGIIESLREESEARLARLFDVPRQDCADAVLGQTVEVEEIAESITTSPPDSSEAAPDTNERTRKAEKDLEEIQVDSWMELAMCRGMGKVFFGPIGSEPKQIKDKREARAIAICAGCLVRQQCLEYAITRRESQGVWGGLTEKGLREITGRGRRRK